MIRHTVLFEIKPNVSIAEVERAFAVLYDLKPKIPGFLRLAGGPSRLHKGRDTNKRLFGFSIDFANEDAYQQFLTDPIADNAKSGLLNVINKEYDGIYGFDMGKPSNVGPTLNPLNRHRVLRPQLRPRGL